MKGLIMSLSLLCCLQGALADVTWKKAGQSDSGGTDIILENQYLRLTIDQDRGGISKSMVNKLNQREEAYLAENGRFGGFAEQRLGGAGDTTEFGQAKTELKVLQEGPEKVSLEFSFRSQSEAFGGLEFKNIYTLERNSARVHIEWQAINHGPSARRINPWVRNIVSGYKPKNVQFGSDKLDSESSTVIQGGSIRKTPSGADAFIEPARNWFARVPSQPEEQNGTLYFIVDYNEIFQFYTVHFKYLHCMEFIFRPVDLPAGGVWKGRYLIACAGPLQDVRFASGRVAANLSRQENRLQLQVTSTEDFSGVRALLLDGRGQEIGRQNLELQTGKTCTAMFVDRPDEDLFELKLMKGDDDLLLLDDGSGSKGKMLASLTQVTVPRMPGKLPAVLENWPRETLPFKKLAARKIPVKQVVQDESGQMLAWTSSSLDRVFEQDEPESAQAPGKQLDIEVAAAANERENFQLAIRNIQSTEIKSLQLEIGDFVAADGQNLPVAWEWHALAYIETTQPSGFSNYPVGRWADPFLISDNFAIEPGQTRTVWVSFKVPAGTAAGEYKATINVRQQQRELFKAEVKLRVFAFELPKKPHLRTDVGRFFGNYVQLLKEYQCFKSGPEISRELSEHLLSRRLTPRGVVANMRDLEAYEQDLIRWKELGATAYFISSAGNAPSDKNLAEIEKLLEKHGIVEESLIYAFDEIHEEQIKRVQDWCLKWKAKSRIPILVVFYSEPVEPLYDYIDIWCRSHRPSDKQLIADRAGKDEVWTTNTPLFSLENDFIKGRAQIWRTFAEGMTGNLLWATASWTSDPWHFPFRSATNLTGVFYYPGASGMVPSARLEVYADAVDDFDYLCILKKLTEKAKNEGGKKELVAQAEKILQDQFYLQSDIEVKEFWQRRLQVGTLIEQLQ